VQIPSGYVIIYTKVNTTLTAGKGMKKRMSLVHKPQYASVHCHDGFHMSVQASKTHYCSPRDNVGPYDSVEVGYPSLYDLHLIKYAEDPDDPTATVYGWVPDYVVRMVIEAHGGMISGELPILICEEDENA
jgi:hypothetical protein